MIKRIELNNFQAHKHTVIDFDQGINAITGESDNGKTAVIRGIRWVLENRPSGIDVLNSNWNEKFKEPMSVKIYTEKGWVERIRSKDRNGYTICINDHEKELSAVGKDVPPEVTEFFNFTDVNTQYQFDPPYLLSMTGGKASEYLNQIIHLDSIDLCLSAADSDKRSLSSEQKVVEADISKLEMKIDMDSWIDEADELLTKIKKYDSILSESQMNYNDLSEQIERYHRYEKEIVDVSAAKDLITKIESIELYDTTELESQIHSYKHFQSQIVDVSEQKKLVDEIESIQLTDTRELEKQCFDWKNYNNVVRENIRLKKELTKQLPDICPYCHQPLKQGCV